MSDTPIPVLGLFHKSQGITAQIRRDKKKLHATTSGHALEEELNSTVATSTSFSDLVKQKRKPLWATARDRVAGTEQKVVGSMRTHPKTIVVAPPTVIRAQSFWYNLDLQKAGRQWDAIRVDSQRDTARWKADSDGVPAPCTMHLNATVASSLEILGRNETTHEESFHQITKERSKGTALVPSPPPPSPARAKRPPTTEASSSPPTARPVATPPPRRVQISPHWWAPLSTSRSPSRTFHRRVHSAKKRREELWAMDEEKREKLEISIQAKSGIVEERYERRRAEMWRVCLASVCFGFRIKRRHKQNRVKLPQGSKWISILRAVRPLVLFQVCINHRRASIIVLRNFLKLLTRSTKFLSTMSAYVRRVRKIQKFMQHLFRRERIRMQLICLQLEAFGGEDVLKRNLSTTLDVVGGIMGVLREERIQRLESYAMAIKEYKANRIALETASGEEVLLLLELPLPAKPRHPALLPAETVKALVVALESSPQPRKRATVNVRKKSSLETLTFSQVFTRCHLFSTYTWEVGMLVIRRDVNQPTSAPRTVTVRTGGHYTTVQSSLNPILKKKTVHK